MGLRDVGLTLPAGFRFCPSDEELVCHYLQNKVAANNGRVVSKGLTMVEVDLHTRDPWELPEAARLGESEWYFFSFRELKYATGLRANRATKTGYWKATGKDRTVFDPANRGVVVGMRKTLVFYTGRAPNGTKSNWVMHEFRLETPHAPPKEDWVLCRAFHKKKGDGARDYYSRSENEQQKNVSSDDNADDSSSSPPHQQGRMCYDYAQMTSQFPTVFGPQHQQPQEESNSSNTAVLSSGWLQHYDFFGGSPQELEKGTTLMGVNGNAGGGDDCGMMFDMGMEEDYHDFYGGGIMGTFECSSSSYQGGKEGHFFY